MASYHFGNLSTGNNRAELEDFHVKKVNFRDELLSFVPIISLEPMLIILMGKTRFYKFNSHDV